MQPHVRSASATANSDTGRDHDECLRVNTAPDERLGGDKGRQAQDSAGQPRGKNSLPQAEHNQLREDSATRERKSQRHSKRCRTRFEILSVAVPEEGEPSPGGAASPTRSSNDEHIDKVSPVAQREETDETHRGSGCYRRRLESTKKELRQRSH